MIILIYLLKILNKTQFYMKKTLLLFVAFITCAATFAQTTKTVTIAAGELSTTLTASELTTITNLTIKGSIDARDFKTMRDKMTALSILNIESANITAYSGTAGTNTGSTNTDYHANEIPIYAFYDYYKTSLTSIVLPTTCTAIGENSFLYCKKLANIKISSLVTVIKSSAFNRCENLTSIQIPSSVKSIEKLAFSFSGLTSITLPETITSLGESIFLQCQSLASANIPTSITEIPNSLFSRCISLKNITLPSNTTKIGDTAFDGCNALTSINIPSSVTSIGSNALSNCDALKSIYMNTSTPPTAGSNAFYGVFNVAKLYVPVGSKIAYSKANIWSWFIIAGNYDNIIEYTPSGIENNAGSNITISSSNQKDIYIINGLSNIATYSILNIQGKIVETGKIADNTEISVSSLTSGIYILNITHEGNNTTFKIIKN